MIDDLTRNQTDQRPTQLSRTRDVIRVMVVDNNEFRRDALSSLLDTKPQIRVTAVALGTTEALSCLEHDPVDVLIADMNIPPNGAVELVKQARSAHRGLGAIVLSDAATPEIASELMYQDAAGIAILGRGDIRRAVEMVSAIEVVANQGTVISPKLVAYLAGQDGSGSILGLRKLTPREREVLAGMARGLSNRAIADELALRVRTVENSVGNILQKLGERGRPDHDGRVRATLFYLEATGRVALNA